MRGGQVIKACRLSVELVPVCPFVGLRVLSG
jgi:hypothetical protein